MYTTHTAHWVQHCRPVPHSGFKQTNPRRTEKLRGVPKTTRYVRTYIRTALMSRSRFQDAVFSRAIGNTKKALSCTGCKQGKPF